MAGKKAKFLIGLFVVTGLMIGVIVIIWVGAADYFMKGATYIAYFDESVQGLQTDSAVKYRGVEIGKVESIEVAPDNRLIEVVMKVNLSHDLRNNIVAQLRTTGITGIVFIELDLIKPGEPPDIITVNFKTDYPVLPSRRLEISRFLSDANKMMQNVRQIDFKGISEQIKNTTKAIENFLAGGRVSNIMKNLESTSANLDKTISRINKIVADGKMDAIVQDTAQTLADARLLINRARKEIEEIKLAETAGKTGKVMDELEKRSKSIAVELQDTAENLRVTSENLQDLSDSLNNNPSELLFDRPPLPKKTME